MDTTTRNILLAGGGIAAVAGIYYLLTKKSAPVQKLTYAAPAPTVATLPKAPSGPAYNGSVASAQAALASLGYSVGTVDGQMGPVTSAALKKFQADRGIPVTGSLDAATNAQLGSPLAGGSTVSNYTADAESNIYGISTQGGGV